MNDEELRAEFAGLRREMEALRLAVLDGKRGAPAAVAGRLLGAIYEAVADRPFSALEIVDHVEIAQAVGLGEAITRACGALNPRKVGKLLAAVEGEDVGGYRVRRVDVGRDGIVWRVVQVSRVSNSRAIA